MSNFRSLAAAAGLPLNALAPMAPANDPFLADTSARKSAAEWFAESLMGTGFGSGIHVRRVHYRLVSAPKPLIKPDGSPYENTEKCWKFLVNASRDARYLGLIPNITFVDRRNPDPIINLKSDEPVTMGVEETQFYDCLYEFPFLPEYEFKGQPSSPFLVEVWCEKSTMNDVLEPLCVARGVNLVTGAGEMSETATRLFVNRALTTGKRARIFYISDFDPAGRSMPLAVSRRIEFLLDQEQADLSVKLIPIVLNEKQCAEYHLPRTPIKETERRAAKFEARFGSGATELDALEAIHPGALKRIVTESIGRYLKNDYNVQWHSAASEYKVGLRKIEDRIKIKFDLDDLRSKHSKVMETWKKFQEKAKVVFGNISDELGKNGPAEFSPPEYPPPHEFENEAVLFDSGRDLFTQSDAYRAWQGKGGPTDGCDA